MKQGRKMVRPGCQFFVVLLLAALGTSVLTAQERSFAGDATSLVVFEYDSENPVLVTILDETTKQVAASIVVGAGAPSVAVPLSPGSYAMEVATLNDVRPGTAESFDVPEAAHHNVAVPLPGESPALRAERIRGEYIAATAVESSLLFQRRNTTRTRWLALGSAVAAGVGATITYVLGAGLYEDYVSATTTPVAADLRWQVEMASGLSVGLGAGAVTGLLVGLIAHFSIPSMEDASAERRELARALAEAQMEESLEGAPSGGGAR